MSDTNVYDSNPKYDQQRNQWYWEGKRTDGKKVRKYHTVANQTTQYDTNQYAGGYQPTPYDATAGLEVGMGAMNLQQQPADTYNTGASNYATWPTDAQAQGSSTYTGESSRHRRRDEGVPSGHHQATPRTVPAPSGYQAHTGPTYEHFQQPSLVSTQTSTNAGYGAGGDSSFQTYNQDKGKGIAGPQSGQDALVLHPEYSAPYGQYGSQNGTSQYGKSPSDALDSGHPQDRSRKSKHKGKGKAGVESNAYRFKDEQRAVEYSGTQQGGYSYSGGTNPQPPSGIPSDTSEFLQGQDGLYTSSSGSRHKIISETYDNLDGAGADGEDEDLQAGIAASRAAYGYGAPGGMSTREGPAYQPTSGSVPPPVPDQRPSKSRDAHISGTDGHFERLDPRFKVERSARFEPGEVFKVMWTEPMGERPAGGGSVITEFVNLQDHMDNVWTGFRRFIVIGNDEGHCTCVPILTYGNQGCRKNGVKAHKHGIVYEQGNSPTALRREPRLGFDPICMQMTAANEHISEHSRVNYSKLVTVEHNVKVFFVGRILYEDWPVVSEAVDRCWGDKKRETPHHNRRDRR